MGRGQRLAVVLGLTAIGCLLLAWQKATATDWPPEIRYADPPNTLAGNHTTPNIIVGGSHLQPGATVSFGQVLAACTFDTPAQVICTAPANTTIGRVTVTLTNPDNQSSVLVDGFTYTGVLNETNITGEADYCTIQPPTDFVAESDLATRKLYGFVAEPGYTDGEQPPERIRAEAGYGVLESDPRSDPTYRFFTAFSNTLSLSGYRYGGAMLAPIVTSPTAFNYSYRFSLDDGLNYTYCDVDGAGARPDYTFDPQKQGRMMVYPMGVTPEAATETPEPTPTTVVPATPTDTATPTATATVTMTFVASASPTATATEGRSATATSIATTITVSPTTSPTTNSITNPTTTATGVQVATPTASRAPSPTITATGTMASTPASSPTSAGATGTTTSIARSTTTATPTGRAASVYLPLVRR